ncbi:ParB/Srx family N-terminal domain-containing protein [Thalassotalea sp. ND16A]|uniref:ParB/Srx family N-terminal domain-containing protein n=1 Tax=Thalassotalea sp. ND16A TaxID=1535422 RepID=UPI00051D7924|nr:ParB/Srx family N-terminal domain-containing protein [Thalassotalea sp. ND16A]KGJ98138.1 hypothetical protein ND16A_0943 [Thalassotalea sp. ND16A]
MIEEKILIEEKNTNENWWEKRVTRSVDQLKLWAQNPRIDPSEEHVKLTDFAEAFIEDNSDKKQFLALVKSIATKGFISFEPVIVWRNEKGKHVVAEGNRRVLAMKLLRDPEKAPRSIRRYIREQSHFISRDDIEKIKVCLAPDFESCEWYILQRHSSSSLQNTWERLQQQRWIEAMCEKYNNDFDIIREKTGFARGEIEKTLRYVKIRDLATRHEVLTQMTPEEKELIYSHRIPMTIIERWFDSADVKEAWGIEYAESDIKITSNEKSFLYAYGKLLKWIFNSVEFSDQTIKPNTRSIPEKNKEFLAILPTVSFSKDENATQTAEGQGEYGAKKEGEPKQQEGETKPSNTDKPTASPTKILNKNPGRNQMVVKNWKIDVSSSKLKAMFYEFKYLPVWKYPNTTAASLRVFLDLSVDEFISCEDLKGRVAKEHKKGYHEVTLAQRLRFLVETEIKDAAANKVIRKLLQNDNEHSLDTLNNYIHGAETHKVERRFLNGFWDMMTPLFAVLISLKEK